MPPLKHASPAAPPLLLTVVDGGEMTDASKTEESGIPTGDH
jgi:hypothetical protein